MLHFLLKVLEFGAAFWFGCGLIAFLRDPSDDLGRLRWILYGPIGLLFQLLAVL